MKKQNQSAISPACFLLAFLPAILYLLWLAVMKITGSAVQVIPAISDEMFYYHQITAMVDSGKPLGFYGYNGTHADVGTFGPWGPAVLVPYALWGKIFGFGLSSMSIANVTFLGLSLCLFALLARLSKKEILYAAIGYCTLLVNLFYSVSSMADPLRWSLAVVLTGCMIRIYRGYGGKFFRYVFLPVFLVYCAQAYMLLMLFVPVYLMLVLPVKKLWKRCLLTVCITIVLAAILWKLLYLVSAQFNPEGLSGGSDSIVEILVTRIREGIQVLLMFLPSRLWAQRGTSYGFPSLFVTAFLIVLIVVAVQIVRGRKSRFLPDYLFAGYLMIGAIGAYCLMYIDPSLWTLCRGLNGVFVCAVLLLALSQNKKLSVLCLALALVALPSFYRMSQNNLKQRSLTEEQLALYEKSQEDFAELFTISKENDPWENTIAQYGMRQPGTQTALTLAMPRSAGYNSMLNTSLVCEAKYALVFHSDNAYPAILENLQENGYAVSYEHEALTILTRKGSG